MRIAVEGCCHGELDAIYREIENRERRHRYKVDLLLICGDFHSIRNEADLETIACPRKYLHLGTFHKYYSGELKVPVPTVFVGGNHESSNYLWELYHGGWVCPGIYFLGWGGVINVGGMRIGGMSGIYKSHHYATGHYEVAPYNDNHKRSVYHVRKYDVYKMLQVKKPMDVFISHDWPLGIEKYGDLAKLLREKKFFAEEVKNNTLGSPAYEQVLASLRPAHWFSAHLHVRYTAVVHWNKPESNEEVPLQQQQQQVASQPSTIASEPVAVKNPDEIEIGLDDDDNDTSTTAETTTVAPAKNLDEIDIDFDEDEDQEVAVTSNQSEVSESTGAYSSSPQPPKQPQQESTNIPANDPAGILPKPYPTCTKFLALDKCMVNRKFLEIIDFPEFNEPIEFKYDEEWLAIIRTLDPFLSLEHSQRPPLQGKALQHALEVNREWVRNNITLTRGLDIPLNFQPTAPAHDAVRTMGPQEKRECIMPFLNPQTVEFSAMLQIQNKINAHCRQIMTSGQNLLRRF